MDARWNLNISLQISKGTAIVFACEHIFVLAKMQPQFPFKWIDTHFMEIDASAINTRKNEWNDAKMQLFACIFDCGHARALAHQ